jgi:regulation of enolase protein 1 (concanavalin A-like superfamily)
MWLRLRRQGSTLTAFHSSDGVTWESLGSQSITMTATVYMGLAVSSHNNSTLCQGVFDNVTVGAINPWTTSDVGAVSIPGNGGVGPTSATVSASGADIYGTADAFTYVHRPLSGDGFLQARVSSQQPTHVWAKAGVMIRESLAADAKHAFMLVSASSGSAFQRRTTTGGSTSNTGSTGAAPIWVRIERTGSTLTAKRSSDGVNWTTVGSASITMASNALIGFAVTSHDNSVTSTAVFDNITAQE